MPQTEDNIEERMREVSRDLNQFRERRLADRRFQARDTADRRVASRPIEGSSPVPLDRNQH